MSRTSKPFRAAFDSECGEGDQISQEDEIVMWDGVAYHVECAEDAGANIPDADRDHEDPYG